MGNTSTKKINIMDYSDFVDNEWSLFIDTKNIQSVKNLLDINKIKYDFIQQSEVVNTIFMTTIINPNEYQKNLIKKQDWCIAFEKY
jgi:hypothetical protein